MNGDCGQERVFLVPTRRPIAGSFPSSCQNTQLPVSVSALLPCAARPKSLSFYNHIWTWQIPRFACRVDAGCMPIENCPSVRYSGSKEVAVLSVLMRRFYSCCPVKASSDFLRIEDRLAGSQKSVRSTRFFASYDTNRNEQCVVRVLSTVLLRKTSSSSKWNCLEGNCPPVS